jgi:hypothetical protein
MSRLTTKQVHNLENKIKARLEALRETQGEIRKMLHESDKQFESLCGFVDMLIDYKIGSQQELGAL